MNSQNDPKKILENVKMLKPDDAYLKETLKLVNNGLLNQFFSLHEVVEALGPSLLSEYPAHRCIGVKFLADTLHMIPQNVLNSGELGYLSSFFSNLLNDHHSTIPAILHGMLALMSYDKMMDEDVRNILTSLFRDVRCQSLPMSERRIIYNIFHTCLNQRLKVLEAMGSEFVVGFVSAMDGEKDPQNLVLMFSIFPFVAKNLALDPFVEDMFEVVAAYFPIDYVPPTHNPYAVSSEDLILGLRKCLSATDQFAQYFIPLLLEKVESDLLSAKIDSLRTLTTCCDNYSASSVQPFLLPLWNCIRKEIIESSNSQVEKEALAALTALITCVERGPSNDSLKDSLNHLASCALMECLGHLSIPEHRLMFTSANLLSTLISPSELLTNSVCIKVLPLLTGMFTSKDDKNAKKNILEILARFMNQMNKFNLFNDVNEQIHNDCCNVVYSGLLSTDLTVVASASLCVCSAKDVIGPDLTLKYAKQIVDLLLASSNDPDLKKSLTAALVACGESNPSILSVEIIPYLLNKSSLGNSNPIERKAALDALSNAVSTPKTVELAVPRLWSDAEQLILEGKTKDSIFNLQSIKMIIQRLRGKSECLKPLCKDWYGVINCVNMAVQLISSHSSPDLLLILEELSYISQDLIRKEDSVCIEMLVCALAGVHYNIPAEMQHMAKISELIEMTGNKSTLPIENQYLFICPLSGLLLGEACFENGKLKEVIAAIRLCSLQAPDFQVRRKAAQLISSLLNRLESESSIEECLGDFEPIFDAPKDSQSSEIDSANSFITLLGWIVKALIMRGSNSAGIYISKLNSLLLTPHGKTAASCFKFLLDDYESIFQGRHGANIKLFYKQRFFQNQIGCLVDQFDSNEGDGKFNTLLAISHLLPFLPQPVIRESIQSLLPVLVQGLACGEETINGECVSTLSTLLSHSVDKLATHVGTLIPRLFDIYSTANMLTRLKCLRCLEYLTTLPAITLLPYKTEVLMKLKHPLNDRKRLVRQQAATTKCSWVLMGSNSEL